MSDGGGALRNRLLIATTLWREATDEPLPKLPPGDPAGQIESFELRVVDLLCRDATPETAKRIADKTWDLVHDRPDADAVKRRVVECHESLAPLSHGRRRRRLAEQHAAALAAQRVAEVQEPAPPALVPQHLAQVVAAAAVDPAKGAGARELAAHARARDLEAAWLEAEHALEALLRVALGRVAGEDRRALVRPGAGVARGAAAEHRDRRGGARAVRPRQLDEERRRVVRVVALQDRKSVVEGKSVDLG